MARYGRRRVYAEDVFDWAVMAFLGFLGLIAVALLLSMVISIFTGGSKPVAPKTFAVVQEMADGQKVNCVVTEDGRTMSCDWGATQ